MSTPTTVRVMNIVRAATRPGEKDVIDESKLIVSSRGDAAKREARTKLTGMGYTLRSMSWSPVLGSPDPVLVAYVMQEPRQ